ncbi:DUF2062 domain-containing protein [Chryseolinea sp. H1M3-3]|uniref:DUF2062 domain-containing protein n=1 Tax=Chryseolinea sp. H1M3-3 TaxID=3034144 RepID=UPI0023EC02A3|nr:DUF2062 domain-containing protein [Chryseolinea sp. H1M3-3]
MKLSTKHVKKVFYDAFRQGLTPHKLAMTCALGVVIGIFPIFGTTTMLCFAIAIAFRLNIAIIQLVNYLVAPLQVLFIVPFIKIGTILFRMNPFPYNADQLTELFQNDFFLLLKEVGLALLLGTAVWATFSLPLFFVLYYLFFLLFSRWLRGPQRELKSQ